CEQCGRPMVVRWGRFGRFLACSGYPQCRHTRPLVVRVQARCPRCGGQLVERKTRRGRTFYGCEHYPQCDYVLWQRPVGRSCPRCGRPLVAAPAGRGRAEGRVVCAGNRENGPDGQPVCTYREQEPGPSLPALAPLDGQAREAAGSSTNGTPAQDGSAPLSRGRQGEGRDHGA
ncbi:MAG TPA: type I DNA topoisomerase, partial [Limnochordales bacterium]